jgi:ABC-2 type transport system permease protein
MDTSYTPSPRPLGAVNWVGLWTLYQKEVWRFLKVITQTVGAPVVTTLLFLAIFALALGKSVETIGGVPYLEFLAPGLIMMALAQNAFANTSSSVMIGKIQGNIVDMLMPPLGPGEVLLGLALGGVTRGVLVGSVTGLAMWIAVPMTVPNPAFVVFHGLAASLMLSLFGIVGGLWAEKFDHMAAVTNYVITPLTFLSGTFYSVERLPEVWRTVALLNPFFYMIDGFRYGFVGHADGDLTAGIAVLLGVDAVLAGVVYRLVARGYKLKA